MRRSRVPGAVLVVLAAIGLGAAGTVWYCVTQTSTLSARHQAAALEIDALVERSARLDGALQAFPTGLDIDISWFTGTAALVTDLHTHAAELDLRLPGVAMAPRARLAEVLQRAGETVDGARANFDAGRTLMALDVVESNGKPASAALASELQAIRTAVAAETAAAQQRWLQVAGGAIGMWALTWTIGLVWLARRRSSEPAASVEVAPPVVEPVAAVPALGAPTPAFPDVADLCERIGRAGDAIEVPALLARSASVLQASGLVLWVREADALVVGAAHGYPDGVAQRLGRVSLGDENLITRAWHSGQCQTSAAAGGRRAAFATPLAAAGGPVGVLAAELGPDADLEAVVGPARVVAAQFAAVLGDATAGARASAADTPVATPNALAG